MKPLRRIVPCCALAISFAFVCASLAAQTAGAPLVYPKAKTVDQVDDYHGVKVADPYRTGGWKTRTRPTRTRGSRLRIS